MRRVIIYLILILLSTSSYSQNYLENIARIKPSDGKDLQQTNCISSDKRYMALATFSSIKIVDLQNFKIVRMVPVEFENVNSVSFLKNGEWVIIIGNKKDGASGEIYNWAEKKLVKQVNPVGTGNIFKAIVSVITPKYVFCANMNGQIFVWNSVTLDLVKTINMVGKEKYLSSIAVNSDESLIAVTATTISYTKPFLYVYDFNGNLKYSHQFTENNLKCLSFFPDNKLILSFFKLSMNDKSPTFVYLVDPANGKISNVTFSKDLPVDYTLAASTGNFLAYKGDLLGSVFKSESADSTKWSLKLLFLEDRKIKKIISNSFGYFMDDGSAYARRHAVITELSDGKFLIPADYENFNYLIDGKSRDLLGFIYHWGSSIAFISSDGRFTGDNEAISNLQYTVPGKNLKLSMQIDQLYTPRLFSQIINPLYIYAANNSELNKIIIMAPGLKIISPDSISNQKSNFVKVKYLVKDNGDGVKEVKFFVNGKLINDDFRGVAAAGESSRDIILVAGENIIEAVAVSNSGYQSDAARVVAKYKGGVTTTNLYILGIGIDKYRNSKYNLNYAVTDATSLTEYIKVKGAGIYTKIDSKVISNEEATKGNIVSELNRIAQQISETDVFILFYAGHGAMSDGSPEVPKDYYLILTDVHQMFGNDALLAEKGISAGELREWSKKIKAQKQIILLDACQSGGATEVFAMRGASEEKAIIQLAQSTGVFLISSTGSDQYATEYEILKHGVFTYALLEGLGGKADGGTKDGKITIKEIEAYLNDIIPELTQKYKGSMQFPNTWSKGMDFPVVVTGN